MGFEADTNRGVNRILCGPDNKIGKCLLNLLNADKKISGFPPRILSATFAKIKNHHLV